MIVRGIALTSHARRRMQQRGVRLADVETLLDHGAVKEQDGGAIVYLDRAGRAELGRAAKRLTGLYIVLDRHRTTVVTIAHKRRNLKLH